MDLKAIAANGSHRNGFPSEHDREPLVGRGSADEHERINGTGNSLGQTRKITLEDVLKEMANAVRIELRDFIAANMKPAPVVGFLQSTDEPPDMRPLLKLVKGTVDNLEAVFDQLAAGGPMFAGARAMILNIKMPLKLFQLEMAEFPDPGALSRGEIHGVVRSCIELEQEMGARLVEFDIAALNLQADKSGKQES